MRASLDDLTVQPARESGDADGVAVVHICGPLEHQASFWGDSYEHIRLRFGEALEESGTVVLCIDSPGGVVSGLYLAVQDMRRAAKNMGARVVAYVNEQACSAAYALACVADEIIVPPSGTVGSIGVRSEMVDATAADEKAGLKWRIITSGAYKADGDPHEHATEGAIAREQARVDKLAGQFYELVSESRGLSEETIAGFKAGVFLGDDAVAAGLADEVMGWEELLVALAQDREDVPTSTAVAQSGTPGAHMNIARMIAKARKALKAEKDPKKRAALKAAIAKHEGLAAAGLPPVALSAAVVALKKTKYRLEEEETTEEDSEDADDMPEDEPKKDDDAEDSDDAEDAEDADDAEDAEDDEDDADAEDDEDGKKAALRAKADTADALAAKLAKIERERAEEKKSAAIAGAIASRRITAVHAKMLAKKSPKFVAEFLSMHTKALFNHADDAAEPIEREGMTGGLHITDAQMDIFRKAAAASGGAISVEKLVEDYRRNPRAANGIKGG